MESSTLKIQEIPLSTLGAFLEASAVHQTADLTELSEFAGFSQSTGKRTVPTLESLGLIAKDSAGNYVPSVEGVHRGIQHKEIEQIVRRALLGFRPFEMFLEGIALGEDADVAVRKTLLLLGLPQGDAKKFDTLLRWGQELHVVDRSNGRVKLVAELAPDATDSVGVLSAEDIESEARARLFNARRLEKDANNYLDETDRGLLADAVLRAENHPRAAMDASGQALEDFLREVAGDEGLGAEARKKSGAGQVANLLMSKGVIHSHHQKMVEAASTIRNATAHRKDKKTLAPWELTTGGAIAAHAMTLTAIRSIHEYVNHERQTI